MTTTTGPTPAAPHGRRLLVASWVAAAILVGATVVQLVRSYGDDRAGHGTDQFLPFSSDFLAAPALYESVAVDGHPLREYQFSAATFMVPDTVLYAPARGAAGGVGAALVPWHMSLFAALVLAAGYALAGVAPPAGRRWVWPAVLNAAALYLAAQAAQFRTLDIRHLHLALPGCHAGAQTLAFLAVGLLARHLRAGGWRARAGYLAGLAAVSAAAAFSDRLYALYLAVPAFSAAGLLAVHGLARAAVVLLGSRRWAGRPWVSVRVLAAAGAVAAGCGAGLAGLRDLPNPGADGDPLKGYWDTVKLDGAGRRAEVLVGLAWDQAGEYDILPVSGLAWLAVAPVLLAGTAIRRTVDPRPLDPAGFVWYQLYGVFAFAAVAGVYVVSATGAAALDADRPAWRDCARYFAGPHAAALFGWALAAATLLGGRGRAGRALGAAVFVAPAGLAAALLAGTLAEGRHADRDPFDPYPRYVRALDEVCRRRGLTAGYSGYWEAKEATHLSKAGVRALPVQHHRDNPDVLTPYVWLSSAGDFSPVDGRPAPDGPKFMIAREVTSEGSDISAATVRAFFGPPAEEVRVGNVVILVYDRETDRAFQSIPDRTAGMALLRYRLSPHTPVRFLAAGLPGRAGVSAPVGSARAADAARDEGGCVAYGPYLSPRLAGPHFAEFRVRSAGSGESNGEVDVLFTDAETEAETQLARAGIPSGHDGPVRLEFDIAPGMVARGRLEFRTMFFDRGRLTLEHVDFGPSRK